MFICSFSDNFYRKEWGFFIFLCLRDKGYLFISLKHGECMRKLVVFVMLMTCVISAQAQWKVTPEAGMNVTKYKGDVAKVGFKAGLRLYGLLL